MIFSWLALSYFLGPSGLRRRTTRATSRTTLRCRSWLMSHDPDLGVEFPPVRHPCFSGTTFSHRSTAQGDKSSNEGIVIFYLTPLAYKWVAKCHWSLYWKTWSIYWNYGEGCCNLLISTSNRKATRPCLRHFLITNKPSYVPCDWPVAYSLHLLNNKTSCVSVVCATRTNKSNTPSVAWTSR
jgi:hypothetical protein